MPPIYHFTDVANLPAILGKGELCGHQMATTAVDVSDTSIKSRRTLIDVTCGPGGKVCDNVPFYYAPRSPMLSSIQFGNVPGVSSTIRVSRRVSRRMYRSADRCRLNHPGCYPSRLVLLELMVDFVTGNLLDAEVDALVNTVNTKGVMGKGVALQFKRAFPENYKAYRAACAAGQVTLGRMFVFDTGRLQRPRYIINFPTKDHWRSRSRLADIETGLDDLRGVITQLQIQSVALPPLGCGLGGLSWSDVRPRIEEALAGVPARALVFEPHGAPAPERMPERRNRPRMTAFRATLIWLLSRYLAPGETASPLEVQKLLYFLQEAGEPLRLTFEKQRYGPYADAARHAVADLEGHYLTGFGDGTGPGDVRLRPGAIEEATAFLSDHPVTLERYQRVEQLIDGFETPYGLELLATTHWVADREDANAPDIAAELVRAWSRRKGHLFTDGHVEVAWRRLDAGDWLAGKRVPAGV